MTRENVLDVTTVLVACLALLVLGSIGWERFGDTLQRGNTEDHEVDGWSSLASGGNRIGPRDPPVTIVEFADYQCPGCRSLAPILDGLLKKYPDDVALVFRHWPLPYHEDAYPAARASECASEQGRFEAFHKLLYSNSEWFSEPSRYFLRFAEGVGIPDLPEFDRCIGSYSPHSNVERDVQAAKGIGARGTPALVVNGIYLGAVPDSIALHDLVSRLLSEG